MAHDGPADGDPLALAPDSSFGNRSAQVFDLQQGRRAVPDLISGRSGTGVQTECHVVENRHVRIQGVRLKHHRHPRWAGGRYRR